MIYYRKYPIFKSLGTENIQKQVRHGLKKELEIFFVVVEFLRIFKILLPKN